MRPRALRSRVWLSAGILILAGAALAAISLSTTTPVTQSFDEIGTTATATLPTDFRVDRPTTVRTVGNIRRQQPRQHKPGAPTFRPPRVMGFTTSDQERQLSGRTVRSGFSPQGLQPRAAIFTSS